MEPLEPALRTLGASQGFAVSTQGDPGYAEQRQEKVRIAWETFNGILTIEGEAPDESVAVEDVKSKIREILGIEELVQMRQLLIRNARQFLDDI